MSLCWFDVKKLAERFLAESDELVKGVGDAATTGPNRACATGITESVY